MGHFACQSMCLFIPSYRAGIAHWQCVGLAVLLDAVSWVQSSSESISGTGDFSLGVNKGFDSIAQQLFGSIN